TWPSAAPNGPPTQRETRHSSNRATSRSTERRRARRPPRARDPARAAEPRRVPRPLLGEPRPAPVAACRDRPDLPARHPRARRVLRLRADRGRGLRTPARERSRRVRVSSPPGRGDRAPARRRRLPAPRRGRGVEGARRARGLRGTAGDADRARGRGGGPAGPREPPRRDRRRTGERLRGAEDDRRLPGWAGSGRAGAFHAHRPGRGPPRAVRPPRRPRGERGDRRSAPGAGAHWLRRLRPLPPARPARLSEAADRALPRDEVRAPPLLPVRPRGGLARARLRQRLVRPLTDHPARVPSGGGAARGARARAGLEAPLRLRRGAHARALLPGREVVARGARRGAPAGGRGGRRAGDPARERARALRAQYRSIALSRSSLIPKWWATSCRTTRLISWTRRSGSAP